MADIIRDLLFHVQFTWKTSFHATFFPILFSSTIYLHILSMKQLGGVQYSPYYYLEENLSGKISVFFILTLPWKNIVKKNASPFEKYKVNSTCEGVTSFHKASIKVGTFTNKSLPTLYKNYHQYPFTHKMQVAIILWVFYVELYYIHFWISKTWSQKIKTYLLFLFSF